jgi:hypothetical protein
VQRGHRDAAVGHRGKVGAVLVLVARHVAVDAVAPPAVGLLGELHAVVVDALPEPGGARAAHLARGAVHVQQRPLGDRHVLELLHHARGEGGRAPEVLARPARTGAEVHLAVVGLLRDGDRRDTEDDPLERGRDGAGVGDVVAQVRAVVDAGHDQLGLEVDQAEGREAHAVDRRAVGGEAAGSVAELDLLDPERVVRRDAARGGRAVRVGRNHGQLDPGHLEEGAPQRVQADGADPVVVGEQDLHDGVPLRASSPQV